MQCEVKSIYKVLRARNFLKAFCLEKITKITILHKKAAMSQRGAALLVRRELEKSVADQLKRKQ